MANRLEADVTGLLAFFIERINLKKLTNEELEYLASATEEAAGEATTLSRIVSGIGCLISNDQVATGMKSGALQDDSVPELLWFISNRIEEIGKMAWIGSEAEYCLRVRAQDSASTAAAESNHG
ncbi:hypothetical protein RVV79_003320 [Burkholderia contaminans]|nr:hypothetical protein [Burkholderia contaminans]